VEKEKENNWKKLKSIHGFIIWQKKSKDFGKLKNYLCKKNNEKIVYKMRVGGKSYAKWTILV